MSELPKGWRKTKIRNIVLPFQTVDPTKEPEMLFTYVDISSIDNQNQVIREPKRLQGKDAPSRARRRIKAGDILFSTVRTYLKNISLVPNELDDAITSTGIAVLRPGPYVDPKFLFNVVRSAEFLDQIGMVMDGTLYPAVTDRDVLDQEILLPPLDEQRRIVAKLDHLLAHSRCARKELSRISSLVERSKQAILAAAFSGELTREWRKNQKLSDPYEEVLENLVTDIRYGTAQKCHSEAKGVAVLRIPNITPKGIDLNDLKYAELENRELAKLRLEEGDILVVRSNGSADLVGRPALVPASMAGLAYAGYLIRLRPDDTIIVPKFLSLMLQTPQTRNVIEVSARSTSGVHNVNSAELAALRIPRPEFAEQYKIIREIETAFARIDRFADEAARAEALLDRLEQATLAKAFRGELLGNKVDED